MKWLREQAVMELDQEGRPLGAFGTTQDITERKRAEEALEAERQRLSSLLDGLPRMVYLKGQDFYLKFANRVFREVCGIGKAKNVMRRFFIGKSLANNCTFFRS